MSCFAVVLTEIFSAFRFFVLDVVAKTGQSFF